MNSTKSTNIDTDIQQFFDQYIMPLHEQAKRRQKYFALTPDPTLDSYFEAPIHPDLLYYKFYHLTDVEQLKNSLAELWQNSGDNDLEKLAEHLANLAKKFKAQQTEQPDELSPYIYAMF